MADGFVDSLRIAYNRKAGERDAASISDWKAEERSSFCRLLQSEQKERLLEIGAGPGHDGLFFKQQGLDVTCIDLSPEMVSLCRRKGLDARVMDMRNLDLDGGTFDGVYALNSLLHIPKAELPDVLAEIHRVMRPGGLFFIGVYGGKESEGVWQNDSYRPKRFFAFYTDESLRKVVEARFSVVSFRPLTVPDVSHGLHFQAVTLRRPG